MSVAFVIFVHMAVFAAGIASGPWVFSHSRKFLNLMWPARSCLYGESLTPFETKLFNVGACPDCGGSLQEGHHNSLSVNYHCANPRCGSRFNSMGHFGVGRTSRASPNLW